MFPRINVGESVLFMDHPGDTMTSMMLVLRMGEDSVDGLVFRAKDGQMGAPAIREGVRHVSDPKLQDMNFVRMLEEEGEGGCFIELPWKLEMQDRVAALEAMLAPKAGDDNPEPEVVTPAKKIGKGKAKAETAVEKPADDVVLMKDRWKEPTAVDERAKAEALAGAKA